MTSNELIEVNYARFLSSKKAGKIAEAADAAARVLEGLLAGVLYQYTGKKWSEIKLGSESIASEKLKITYLYRQGFISRMERKKLEWLSDNAKKILVLSQEGVMEVGEENVEMLGNLLDIVLDDYFSFFCGDGAEQARAAAKAGRKELEVYGEKVLKRARVGLAVALMIAIGILSFRLFASRNKPDLRSELLREGSVSLMLETGPALF